MEVGCSFPPLTVSEAGHVGCWGELGETEEQTSAGTFDGDKGSHHRFELETA